MAAVVGAAAVVAKRAATKPPTSKKAGWHQTMLARFPSLMPFPLESLAALATIAGTVISVLALLHSRSWLVLTSLLFVGVSIIAGLYARRERLALNAAFTTIEGYSIDSLNMANLRRRVNRTFVIQEARHTARIEGGDLKITWAYSGYCRAHRQTAMEFSIDADRTTPFQKLDCVAYEGISKKISVPFLDPIKADQPFSVLLKCTLPGCFTKGFGYYTSSLSFAQERVGSSAVHLIFVGPAPAWLRVYESTPRSPARLVKSLAPSRQQSDLCEYLDVVEGRQGQSVRVYAFWLDSV